MKLIKKYFDKYFSIKILLGYRKLKKKKKLDLFCQLKNSLTNCKLSISNNKKFFLEKNKFDIEISIRQYLLKEIGGYTLNKTILLFFYYNIPLCYPMPKEWFPVFKNHNIKINKLVCSFLWKIFLVYKLIDSLRYFFQSHIDALKSHFNKNYEEFIYCFSLNSKNFPEKNKVYENYGIFSFIQKKNYQKKVTIFHDVEKKNFNKKNLKVKFKKNFFFQSKNLFTQIAIFFWFVYFFLFSILDILRSGWHTLMLTEGLKSFQIKKSKKTYLAKKYYFNQSSHIYRPIWTYEAEKKGSEIIFYFYSTNHNYIFQKNYKKKRVYFLGWKIITWNKILVWDEYQKKFIKNLNKKINIEIVNYINFTPSIKNKIKFPKKSIIVFDVRPVKKRFWCWLGHPYEFYNSKNSINFIKNILDIIIKMNAFLIIKQKRSLMHEEISYKNYINKIKKFKNVLVLSEGICLENIIKQSKVTISYPYTSTALISSQLIKNNAYYDSSGVIAHLNEETHGIKHINCKLDLKKYINSVF